MGFWVALDKAFPGIRHQRCRVHKVKNVLNCFPKKMAAAVNPIWTTFSTPEFALPPFLPWTFSKRKMA